MVNEKVYLRGGLLLSPCTQLRRVVSERLCMNQTHPIGQFQLSFKGFIARIRSLRVTSMLLFRKVDCPGILTVFPYQTRTVIYKGNEISEWQHRPNFNQTCPRKLKIEILAVQWYPEAFYLVDSIRNHQRLRYRPKQKRHDFLFNFRTETYRYWRTRSIVSSHLIRT